MHSELSSRQMHWYMIYPFDRYRMNEGAHLFAILNSSLSRRNFLVFNVTKLGMTMTSIATIFIT